MDNWIGKRCRQSLLNICGNNSKECEGGGWNSEEMRRRLEFREEAQQRRHNTPQEQDMEQGFLVKEGMKEEGRVVFLDKINQKQEQVSRMARKSNKWSGKLRHLLGPNPTARKYINRRGTCSCSVSSLNPVLGCLIMSCQVNLVLNRKYNLLWLS